MKSIKMNSIKEKIEKDIEEYQTHNINIDKMFQDLILKLIILKNLNK